MDYQLTIVPKSTYLHAIVSGTNTKENITNYLEELREEGISRKCFRVLIEEHLEGPRINISDVFSIVKEVSNRVIGVYEAIAYVDVNAVGDSMQFAETVARNRGLQIAMFSSVVDAEKWLQNYKKEKKI
jgi:hypothetical protein